MDETEETPINPFLDHPFPFTSEVALRRNVAVLLEKVRPSIRMIHRVGTKSSFLQYVLPCLPGDLVTQVPRGSDNFDVSPNCLSRHRYGSPSRRDDLTIDKTHRSPTWGHPIVRHVFRATVHCLEAGMWHRLSYHEGHEEHEENQSTNRSMPSFRWVTLKFISSPTLISANLI